MKSKPMPSQEILKTLLDYNPETGALTWRSRLPAAPNRHDKAWETKNVGKEAGWDKANGYRGICFDAWPGMFLVHRIIWKLVTGEEPQFIDHINLVKNDHRWCNLRNCTKTENQGNRIKRSDNSSGFKNIGWDNSRQKWRVQIAKKGSKKFMKRTQTLAAAIAYQRLMSAIMYGEFARIS